MRAISPSTRMSWRPITDWWTERRTEMINLTYVEERQWIDTCSTHSIWNCSIFSLVGLRRHCPAFKANCWEYILQIQCPSFVLNFEYSATTNIASQDVGCQTITNSNCGAAILSAERSHKQLRHDIIFGNVHHLCEYTTRPTLRRHRCYTSLELLDW